VAEDHGLGDGDGPVDVAEGLELLLPAVAEDVILLDGVQRLLFPLQLDDVGVGNHLLGKLPHRVLEGGREEQHLPLLPSPLDADALVLVPLGGDHDIGLIQNKHPDLFGVNELELGTPVQDGARCADDDLFGDLLATASEVTLKTKTDSRILSFFPLLTGNLCCIYSYWFTSLIFNLLDVFPTQQFT
uniref:Uncharacterized protein n=1 Tax=Naja naja TaxID=35670 RepID=A0A8C6XZG8_NAJNA